MDSLQGFVKALEQSDLRFKETWPIIKKVKAVYSERLKRFLYSKGNFDEKDIKTKQKNKKSKQIKRE